MQNKIHTITLPLPYRMGSVNCYLVETEAGFILIDSGGSNNRQALIEELDHAGCRSGALRLIVLTHGDFDHTGNAAYLRHAYGCKIAMHVDDAGMVASGDMFVNRHAPNRLMRSLMPMFTGFGKSERFTPDVLLGEGDDLSDVGLQARILSLPGHSKGSIGVLTDEGVLFCGDLLINLKKPQLTTLIDDLAAAQASLNKLANLNIGTVYPGHGKPFPMQMILQNDL